jgi:uncharacterized DUF497 family protein
VENDEIKLRLGDLAFTWDDEKALLNFQKHKVTFELASEVFFDDAAIERENVHFDELRLEVLDMSYTASNLLFVVFMERITLEGEDVLRIISARKATKRERLDYEKGRDTTY